MESDKNTILAEERFTIHAIRVIACLFIYLCHACLASETTIGNICGMFFNVGVPIFFMLSGYLYNGKTLKSSCISWYVKQGKKLLIPLWIFLGILFAVLFALSTLPSGFFWWTNIIPLAGITESYLPGCGHLWFITHILVCYLGTPILMRLKRPERVWGISILYIVVKLVSAYTLPAIMCTLLASIGSYLVGFYCLPRWKQHYKKIAYLIPCAIAMRLMSRLLFDDSVLYDLVLSDLSHKLLAVSLIALAYQLARFVYKPGKFTDAIEKLSQYTYEFYLVHQPLILGAIALGVFANTAIVGAVCFLASLVAAWVLHELSIGISKVIGKRRQ